MGIVSELLPARLFTLAPLIGTTAVASASFSENKRGGVVKTLSEAYYQHWRAVEAAVYQKYSRGQREKRIVTPQKMSWSTKTLRQWIQTNKKGTPTETDIGSKESITAQNQKCLPVQ